MKCILYTKGAKKGQIERVADETAHQTVKDKQARYVPKLKWKLQQRENAD